MKNHFLSENVIEYYLKFKQWTSLIDIQKAFTEVTQNINSSVVWLVLKAFSSTNLSRYLFITYNSIA